MNLNFQKEQSIVKKYMGLSMTTTIPYYTVPLVNAFLGKSMAEEMLASDRHALTTRKLSDGFFSPSIPRANLYALRFDCFENPNTYNRVFNQIYIDLHKSEFCAERMRQFSENRATNNPIYMMTEGVGKHCVLYNIPYNHIGDESSKEMLTNQDIPEKTKSQHLKKLYRQNPGIFNHTTSPTLQTYKVVYTFMDVLNQLQTEAYLKKAE